MTTPFLASPTTARLSLQPPDPALAEQMVAYLRRNASRFEPVSPRRDASYYTVELWRELAAEHQSHTLAGSALHVWVFVPSKSEQLLIGEVHVTNIVRGVFQAGHLGYALDAEHEGRGLMQEALERVIEHAFTQLGLHRLMANYLPSNERSGRLLRRLGFVVEGYARDYLQLDGIWKDHILTARTAE